MSAEWESSTTSILLGSTKGFSFSIAESASALVLYIFFILPRWIG